MKKQQIMVLVLFLASVMLLASCSNTVSEKTQTNPPVTKTNTAVTTNTSDSSMMQKEEGVMVG